ncbi:MAG TPA: hypothetical protein VGM75_25175 [Pseudonocardiaceae bacterium]
MNSQDVRRPWAAHKVNRRSHGSVRLVHPLAGELTLRYESFAPDASRDWSAAAVAEEPA